MTAGTLPTGVAAQARRSTSRRKLWWLAAGIAGLAGSLALVAIGRWPMVYAVETGKTPEYPYLKPVTFAERPEVIVDMAQETIRRFSGWTLESADRDEGILKARVVTSFLHIESEVTIQASRIDGVTRVTLRSESPGASRFGDFGQNARNIRKFVRELKATLDRAQAARGTR